MSARYITDERINETFAKWLTERHTFNTISKMETEFIKKRIDDLREQDKRMWDNIFQAMKKEGLISETAKREDYSISITKDKPVQLFIEERDGRNSFLDLMSSFGRGQE